MSAFEFHSTALCLLASSAKTGIYSGLVVRTERGNACEVLCRFLATQAIYAMIVVTVLSSLFLESEVD